MIPESLYVQYFRTNYQNSSARSLVFDTVSSFSIVMSNSEHLQLNPLNINVWIKTRILLRANFVIKMLCMNLIKNMHQGSKQQKNAINFALTYFHMYVYFCLIFFSILI